MSSKKVSIYISNAFPRITGNLEVTTTTTSLLPRPVKGNGEKKKVAKFPCKLKAL